MARIIFDLDGTLIDSVPDIQACANAVLLREGYEPISLEQVRIFVGNGANVFVQNMRIARSIPDADHEKLLADFLSGYDSAVHLTVVYPGVLEALEQLKDQGHQLGICTNKPLRPCKAVLRHLDLERFFETVYGGDSLAVHKPSPQPLLAAFEALGEGEALYIGDSEIDAETAKRANVQFALYTEGYRKGVLEDIPCAATFSDFNELPALVARLLSGQVAEARKSAKPARNFR